MKSTQRKQFDLIIQMQGDGTITNSVVQLLGGKLTAGFYPPKDFCPNNDLYFPYQENIHEVVLQTNLLEFLGFSVQSLNLEFPFQANDYRDFAKLNLGRIKKPVVCLHPGAKNPEKRWAVKNFAKLASELASLDYQVIITGTKEEMELAQYIEKAAPKSTINLVGKTSLGSLALLLKKADLLITNDTGVSHLATALKTKSLVIFQKTDPTRWAPTNTNLHKTVLAEEALFPKVLDLAKHAIGGKNYA